jgi:hypothetical protein
MASAEPLAAPASARLIMSTLSVFRQSPPHYVGRWSAVLKKLSHDAHGRTRVSEEQFQACAKVVLSRVSVAGEYEPIFRTAAVTERPDLAAPALRGERIALIVSELALLGRGDELQQMRLMNVTQSIARFNEVITGVDIAVVLECRAVAARGRVNA